MLAHLRKLAELKTNDGNAKEKINSVLISQALKKAKQILKNFNKSSWRKHCNEFFVLLEKSGLYPSFDLADKLLLETKLEKITTELAKIRQEAIEIRNKIVEANFGLVHKFALPKQGFVTGLDINDLEQEGKIGLMKAVGKFDYRRDVLFSGYASQWIKQAMDRAIDNQGHMISVSVNTSEKLRQISHASMSLSGILSRQPTIDELSEKFGLEKDTIEALRKIVPEPFSLETQTFRANNGNVQRTFWDFIENKNSPQPIDLAIISSDAKRTEIYLSLLPVRQAQVLRLRFGIGCEREYTLNEIGKEYWSEIGSAKPMTRERIRQIEVAAKKRLRRILKHAGLSRGKKITLENFE